MITLIVIINSQNYNFIMFRNILIPCITYYVSYSTIVCGGYRVGINTDRVGSGVCISGHNILFMCLWVGTILMRNRFDYQSYLPEIWFLNFCLPAADNNVRFLSDKNTHKYCNLYSVYFHTMSRVVPIHILLYALVGSLKDYNRINIIVDNKI